MPLVEISVVAGIPPEQIRKLIGRVHAAVRDSLDVREASVRILVREIPAAHWAVGGVTKAEQEPQQEAPDG